MKASQVTVVVVALVASFISLARADGWVEYPGGEGLGKGKHIVLISGDEEYRSEETMPMLGRLLSEHHGFKCTVLFSLAEDGTIDPNNQANITGLQALETADLTIISTRFRNPPDRDMKYVDDYLKKGKPVIGLRTATHAFAGLKGPFAKYNNGYQGAEWQGGFGREILGEQWISHHGHHGVESTRGIISEDAREHPIARGIRPGEIWGTTDVYGVRLPLPGGCKTLVYGQVLEGMNKDDKPVAGEKNDPMMPVVWTKTYQTADGKTGRVLTTTMGASQDFVEPGLRRLVVNAVFWCLGMEDQITPDLAIDIVGDFHPTSFGFKRPEDGHWKRLGRRPEDYAG